MVEQLTSPPPMLTAPSPEATSSITPDVLAINPDLSVSSQVFKDAVSRGRPDLVGLTWEHEGKLHTISAHDVLHRVRPEYKRVGQPLYHREGRIHNFDREVAMERTYYDEPHYTVDTYEDGKLASIAPLARDRLEQQLNLAQGINHVVWQPKEEAPTSYERINLPLRPGTRTAFDDITHSLEGQNIYNWEGLRWEKAGHISEVVRDAPVFKKVSSGARPTRAWLVRTYDQDGKPVHEEVYKGDAFKEFVNAAYALPHKAPKDLHLNRPKPELESSETEDRRSTQALLKGLIIQELPEDLEDIDESDKPALWLLSYIDVVTGGGKAAHETRRNNTQKILDLPESKRRIKELNELIHTYGLDAVLELAVRLHDRFEESMDKLSLPVTNGNRSISWVVESLADHYYFSKYPNKITKEFRSATFHNPFVNPYSHHDIVDEQIGAAFLENAIVADLAGKPEKLIDKGGFLDIKMRAMPTFERNHKLLRYTLSNFRQQQIENIVDEVIESEGELSKYVEIRRQLGRELGRTIAR